MNHLPILVQDLAIILIVAGATTLLFKRLNQPVVLGYLLAGVLAGPYFLGESWITGLKSIQIWGEIGVIFLLFSLGLEFSIRKLMRMGPTAFIGATTILFGMMSTGYLVGLALGWSQMNALFLGAMLSMSSTTIVFKALDDMGLRQKQFAQVVFSVLIVEDLYAIVLMVLLTTFAVSTSFAGLEMVMVVGKLIGYLLFFFVGGIWVIPTFLKAVKRYLNNETMLVLSLGLCLGMVILAASAGFSAALGAFVMGSILAETLEAERIEKLIKPVKDLFGAVFFVSVGMLIDPAMLITYWVPILVITLTVVCGQLIFATAGTLLSGESVQVAIQSGFTLTQIGEFAFIIAGLGVNLGVTDHFLYPVAVAVSVITTFITPFMIRVSPRVYTFVDKHMSERMRYFFAHYRGGTQAINDEGVWRPFLQSILQSVVLYGGLSWIVLLSVTLYVMPKCKLVLQPLVVELVGGVVLFLLIAPLLRPAITKHTDTDTFESLWQETRFNRGWLFSIVVFRYLFGFFTLYYLMAVVFTLPIIVNLTVALLLLALLTTSKHLKQHSQKIENQFFRNFRAREEAKDRMAPVRKALENSLLEHDLHLVTFTIPPTAMCLGKTLRNLHFRQLFKVNVVRIIRGKEVINIPTADERLYPYDQMVVAGTDAQLEPFKVFIESKNRLTKERWEYPEMSLEHFFVSEESLLIGKTLKEVHFQNKASSLVVSVERQGEVLPSLDATFRFEKGDLVWIVGVLSELRRLLERMGNGSHG